MADFFAVNDLAAMDQATANERAKLDANLAGPGFALELAAAKTSPIAVPPNAKIFDKPLVKQLIQAARCDPGGSVPLVDPEPEEMPFDPLCPPRV